MRRWFRYALCIVLPFVTAACVLYRGGSLADAATAVSAEALLAALYGCARRERP